MRKTTKLMIHFRARKKNAFIAILNILFIFVICQSVYGQRQDDAFFDSSVLHDVYLDLQESDWQALRDNYLENTYYPSDFRWNGITVSNIAIRSRGSGSRSPEKPNLRLNFNRNVSGQRFLGLKDVALKANNQDASLIRETSSFALMRRMGIPAPREAHARLFINGEFFGLYTIVEMINEDFLSRVFQEDEGYLYEYERPGDYDFSYLGDDPSVYLTYFSPVTHEDEPNVTALMEMIRRVNFAADEEFEEVVSPYLNLEHFMRVIAVQNYLADGDGILSGVFGMNNFYIYQLVDRIETVFLPWDMDLSLFETEKPILAGIEPNVLARRAFAVPRLRQIYLEALAQAAAVAGGADGWLEGEFRRQYALIAEDAQHDVHKQCMKEEGMVPCTFEDFEQSAQGLFAYPSMRTSFVLEELSGMLSTGPPQAAEGGIVNAATHSPPLSPGSLATLYGSALALTNASAETLPLPVDLAGVTVTVNGTPAPLLFVSPFQVNFQVPWGTLPGTASVALSRHGEASETREAEVQDASPGIFGVFHADWREITPSFPAVAGESVVIYATGLGEVIPPLQDGEPGSHEEPSVPVHPVEVKIGDLAAEVEFSGIVDGLVGVFQINVRLPEELATGGDTPLTVTVNGQTSPAYPIYTQEQAEQPLHRSGAIREAMPGRVGRPPLGGRPALGVAPLQ